jgi:hypothetical protein
MLIEKPETDDSAFRIKIQPPSGEKHKVAAYVSWFLHGLLFNLRSRTRPWAILCPSKQNKLYLLSDRHLSTNLVPIHVGDVDLRPNYKASQTRSLCSSYH